MISSPRHPRRLPRRTFSSGFTLVELLVVIGIIALLIGILLPTLGRARESSKQIACASNLRSVGQGFVLYTSENNFFLPAAYVYNTSGSDGIAPDVGGGSAAEPTLGYTHWSFLIYGDGETTPEEAFSCPEFDDGGLASDEPEAGRSCRQVRSWTPTSMPRPQRRRASASIARSGASRSRSMKPLFLRTSSTKLFGRETPAPSSRVACRSHASRTAPTSSLRLNTTSIRESSRNSTTRKTPISSSRAIARSTGTTTC